MEFQLEDFTTDPTDGKLDRCWKTDLVLISVIGN